MRFFLNVSLTALLLAASSLAQAGMTLAGVGYESQDRFQVAPGQVITLFLTGLTTVLPTSLQRSSDTQPWPFTIAGISARVQQGSFSWQIPVFAVEQRSLCTTGTPGPGCSLTAVTVQIPFDLLLPVAGGGWHVPPSTDPFLTITEGEQNSASFRLFLGTTAIHVLRSCDVLFDGYRPPGFSATSCDPIVSHADGTLVSSAHPALVGEAIILYSVGLGATVPAISTGVPAPSPASVVKNLIKVSFDGSDPSVVLGGFYSIEADSAEVVPGYVGLYAVKLHVPSLPSPATPCYSGFGNLLVTLASPTFSSGPPDTVRICVNSIRAE